MKKMKKEQMENVIGGKSYCEQLDYWLHTDSSGYQGSICYLAKTYYENCRPDVVQKSRATN